MRGAVGSGTGATSRPAHATPWPAPARPDAQGERFARHPGRGRCVPPRDHPEPADDSGTDDAGGEMGNGEGALHQRLFGVGVVGEATHGREHPCRMMRRWSSGSSWAALWKITRRPSRGTPWTAGQNKYGVTATRSHPDRAASSSTSGQTGPTRSTNRLATASETAAGFVPDRHVERTRTRVAPRHRSAAVDGDPLELTDPRCELVRPCGRRTRARGEDLDVPALQGDEVLAQQAQPVLDPADHVDAVAGDHQAELHPRARTTTR